MSNKGNKIFEAILSLYLCSRFNHTKITIMKASDNNIELEFTYPQSVEVLWENFTVYDKVTQWFFKEIKEFEPKIGYETEFVVKLDEKTFTHCWYILDFEPQETLSMHWWYEEYDGEMRVTFDFDKEKTGSKIKVTIETTDDFPQDMEEFKRESCINGWNYFLGKSLPEYLKKNSN